MAHYNFWITEVNRSKSANCRKILKEINDRLNFLINVGLNYLNLSRSAETLSGGEAQRIRLASQIGAGLVGVMYVLDEPSIGLHQRDNERLLKTLIHLRDLGNTVIVVEHDEDAIRAADHVIDIGPGAGVHGGNVIAEGTMQDILANPNSLTGQYLSGVKQIEVPKKRTPIDKKKTVELIGATGNNLQNVNLSIPVGLLTCVTGVSGSGKSTLINDTFFKIAHARLNGATTAEAAPYKKSTALSTLIRLSILTKAQLVERHVQTLPPTPVFLHRFVNCLQALRNPALVATNRDVLVLTFAVVAVKLAKVMALSKSRCTSCLMCTFLVTPVKVSVITVKP